MIDHGFLNVIWLAILVYGIVGGVRRAARRPAKRRAERAAAWTPIPASRPAPRPTQQRTASQRPKGAPAFAAAAFPELDLSLPGAELLGTAPAARRRARSRLGGPAVGSGPWMANAVVGAEVLGLPVALRSGATFGVPRAF